MAFFPTEFLIFALVTLFVVVDPVGLVPAFLGVKACRNRRGGRSVCAPR